ncbi:MAG: FAD-dependent oxidoreductase, partial [Pseudomonadota bacterium]
MRVAIIGSGISGLTAAYRLHQYAEVTVFEKNSVLGGHTATIDTEIQGE